MAFLLACLLLLAPARAALPEDIATAADGNLPTALREEAYGRLVSGGDVEGLLAAARDTQSTDAKRWIAVRALGPMKTLAARDALVKLIDAPDAFTRIAVLGAFGDRGDRLESGRVAARLEDPALLVRLAAADALGKIKDPNTLADLGRALQDPSNRHHGASLFLRRAYTDAVAAIGTESAVPVLAKALGDDDPAVVRAAVNGLEKVAGFDYREGRTFEEQLAAWRRWAGVGPKTP
jgi:HEAT repeat protein